MALGQPLSPYVKLALRVNSILHYIGPFIKYVLMLCAFRLKILFR